MNRVVCGCGHSIVFSEWPVEGESAHFPSARWDEVVAALVAVASLHPERDPMLLSEAISDALAVNVEYFYRCPDCQQIIFRSEGGARLDRYVREES